MDRGLLRPGQSNCKISPRFERTPLGIGVIALIESDMNLSLDYTTHLKEFDRFRSIQAYLSQKLIYTVSFGS